MSSINISIRFGRVEFHVIKIDTFFLLCLIDINRLKIYLNDFINVLIMLNKIILIVCCFDYFFMFWNNFFDVFIIESFLYNSCFLIEIELKRLHRRFDHLSIIKLHHFLKQSDHEINKQTIENFTKFCTKYQKHEKLLDRFRFIIRNEVQFNYFIFVDIIYIDKNPIFHVIDKAIRY